MKKNILFRRTTASWRLLAALTFAGGLAFSANAARPPVFTSVNNDSDILGVANWTDLRLTNPWGLTTGTEGNLHVCDNVPGLETIYAPDGSILSGSANTVTIQPATTGTGTPTGIDENLYAILNSSTSNDFVITSGTVSLPAHYLYCTEDGLIEGSRSAVSATSAIIGPNDANQSGTGAGYTGIALSWATSGTNPGLVHQLYAANFALGRIDVFDNQFHLVTLSGSAPFAQTPPAVTGTVPGATWSPFNIHRVDYKQGKTTVRQLLVVYALHTGTDSMTDLPGPGNGYADLYTPEGVFVKRLVAPGGALDSPWGVAVSHSPIANLGAPIVVLIGNHGDGQINAYSVDPKFPDLTGVHLGTLMDPHSDPLAFAYLWALHFGPKKITFAQYATDPADLAEDGKNLYFSAGIVEEQRGLVGRIVLP